MKSNFILALLILSIATSASFADTTKGFRSGGGINISGASPSEIANRANKGNKGSDSDSTSAFDEMRQNPFVNGYMNTMTGMMQGFSGSTANMQEQTRQQADYMKQQMNCGE